MQKKLSYFYGSFLGISGTYWLFHPYYIGGVSPSNAHFSGLCLVIEDM
jgi:hypothetical protein